MIGLMIKYNLQSQIVIGWMIEKKNSSFSSPPLNRKKWLINFYWAWESSYQMIEQPETTYINDLTTIGGFM